MKMKSDRGKAEAAAESSRSLLARPYEIHHTYLYTLLSDMCPEKVVGVR